MSAVIDPNNSAGIDPDELDPLKKPFWKTNELHRLGMGHQTAVLAAIKAGDIDAVRIGRKLLIPTAWVRRALGLDAQPPAA
jgi:hypothetical protein